MPRHTAPARPHHLRWWLALLLLVAFFCVEYFFFVHLRPGQWADQAGFVAWSQWWPRTELLDPVRQFLDLLPVICGAIAAVFLLYRVIRDRRFLRATVALLACAAALASTQLLKHGVLIRPDFNFGTTGNSFPSGHTTAAAAAMGLMFVIAPPKLRPAVQPIAWLFATVTGVATLVCGWHRPSDIAAGFLVAAFWMVLASAVLQRIQPLSHEVPNTGWSRGIGTASIIVWAIVVVLSFILPHPHIQRIPDSLQLAYAVLGILHVIAASLISSLALRSVVIGPMRTFQK
ncbi:phosphatase PAP2 family protein [Glutamicibacter sp. JL.03c]|uniref:phosphatase PAP2 family protein n=1 Tax=Glutamicibacter sp. JL.03c TaxID=2984842 RepID=UPI0021F6D002|nr:phosphatase PAP2 family protein [Glutamicibacter sp. JL.03c]UYQ76666.1 phosphatase PAP2 family protein [Glutamicibacter sp. JL.03c]